MICHLAGRLATIRDDSVVLDRDGIGYEVLMPIGTLAELQGRAGEELKLFTIQYLEGNPAGANLIPRTIGFLSEADRAFFQLFTKVKGVSMRKALRAMGAPTPQLAAAIENGDVRMLQSLPEIGKKTASQIVADLQGKLTAFATSGAVVVPAVSELTAAQRVAIDILVQWGDRRADAQRWVAAAVERYGALTEPDDIVRAAYGVKRGE